MNSEQTCNNLFSASNADSFALAARSSLWYEVFSSIATLKAPWSLVIWSANSGEVELCNVWFARL